MLGRQKRLLSALLAISMIAISFLLSAFILAADLISNQHSGMTRLVRNICWFQFGEEPLRVGWIIDPLTSLMLVMVSTVSLLVFIYSTKYMKEDDNFTRFFCFLSLFSGAMLGVVISNSLLLLFMFWEVVGLSSYLLIGFWFSRPSAVAAAQKAFLITRIGDIAFFIGMVWLYAKSGTLLFYDNGAGLLEHTALSKFLLSGVSIGTAGNIGIALLILCGAIGKSGQFPLHIWLPDAMEGPTPVSALIHAATMVAAGVFLLARLYPIMSGSAAVPGVVPSSVPLQAITWIGALTALLGALLGVAQFDIKRILAYSTISQLGYMMLGLGTGGVAVGMFHLITHAFFKALLFLGAGSVIHGCSGEQDIRYMGGLRKKMPATFITYTVGAMALCGVPFCFSGFWSKDAILHAAKQWDVSMVPFYMGSVGVALTAFYMMRQILYVFAGESRLYSAPHAEKHHLHSQHESHPLMTVPLVVLAIFAVFLGFIGTPAWPWLQYFLDGQRATIQFSALAEGGFVRVMLSSSLLLIVGVTLAWLLYWYKRGLNSDGRDNLEVLLPRTFSWLAHGLYIETAYDVSVIRLNRIASGLCKWVDQNIFCGISTLAAYVAVVTGRTVSINDQKVFNSGFDTGCRRTSGAGRALSQLQSGTVQDYLRWLVVAFICIFIFMVWGTGK